MKKWMFLLLVFTFLFTGNSFSQEKQYHKISALSYWDTLSKIGKQVRADGSRKFEFGNWIIYFPKRYINFVMKIEKSGKTFERKHWNASFSGDTYGDRHYRTAYSLCQYNVGI